MQLSTARASLAARTRVLASLFSALLFLGLFALGCANGDQGAETEELGSTAQAFTYSPPTCGASCVNDGTLAAMNAAAVKYGFPRWFVYATVNRESSFNPKAQNGSGTGKCDIGYGLTQITCPHHIGLSYPENLSAPNQSSSTWQGDMRISGFCSETGLCPWIDMANVTSLGSAADRFDPVKNLDRYFSGYAAPAFYLERMRAPQQSGESTAAFNNRILRRVAWHWRYGHYASIAYPTDPYNYLSGPDSYRWDNYATTYRTAVEAEDGVWDGNVCKPPYSAKGCGATSQTKACDTNDTAKYNFECSNAQGWAASTSGFTSVATSTARSYNGSASLALTLSSATGSRSVATSTGTLPPAGSTVSFHVWLPAGSNISWVQPYLQQGAAGNWAWIATTKSMSQLQAGAWNTITVAVPPGSAPLASMGLQLGLSAAWTGTIYVDAVSW